MGECEALDTLELEHFRHYLAQLERILWWGDYESHFYAHQFKATDSVLNAHQLLTMAYPNCDLTDLTLFRCSPEEMVEKITPCLKKPLYTAEMVIYLAEGITNPYPKAETQTDYSESYLQELRTCIDFERGEIFACGGEVPYFCVHWQFTYIIWHREQQRCLIIHGGASD